MPRSLARNCFHLKNVVTASRLIKLPVLEDEEAERLLSDYRLFERRLEEVLSHPANAKKCVPAYR